MSKHVGSGQARTGKVRLIVEDSSYPLGQLRIHGITGLQSHVSEEVAGPSGWYAVAGIDRQTQDRLAIDAQPQQSALQLEKLVLGVGAGRKCDCRPGRYPIGFGAQAVGFHIYLAVGQVVKGEQFVCGCVQALARVRLQRAVQLNGRTPTGHIDAIELRLIERVGKLDEQSLFQRLVAKGRSELVSV